MRKEQERLLALALDEARRRKHGVLTAEHLLLTLLQQDDLREAVQSYGISAAILRMQMDDFLRRQLDVLPEPPEPEAVRPERGMGELLAALDSRFAAPLPGESARYAAAEAVRQILLLLEPVDSFGCAFQTHGTLFRQLFRAFVSSPFACDDLRHLLRHGVPELLRFRAGCAFLLQFLVLGVWHGA